MQNIVISIGGSVVLSDDIDVSYFSEFKKLIQKHNQNYRFFIIVGGGKTARSYIALGRKLGFDEETLDQIGINLTRINASILSTLFDANKIIPESTDDAIKIDESIVIMGGTTPGHSTDMVGAELAEKTNASKLIIATNVDGVYDKDPNKFEDAKKFSEISIHEMMQEFGTDWKSAGKNMVIDGPALKIISESNYETFVLNGKSLEEIEKVLTNQEFNGTKILK